MAKIPGGKVQLDEIKAATTEPVPEGTYVVRIIDSEHKDNSKGTGSYLKLTFAIAEGEYEGRRIWENLNLVNPNEKAVEIAFRTLKSIADACGISGELEDSEDLHGIDLVAEVVISPGSGGYGPSNSIKKYVAL